MGNRRAVCGGSRGFCLLVAEGWGGRVPGDHRFRRLLIVFLCVVGPLENLGGLAHLPNRGSTKVDRRFPSCTSVCVAACSVPLLFPRPCLAPLPGCRQPRPALLPPLPPPPLFPPQDLVPSFVSILKQITEHRLPRDFDYHRMPAPWIQMRLLRILALLGRADRATRWERKRGGSFAGDLGGAGRKLTPLCCIVMGSLSLPLIRSQGPAAGTRL